MTEVESYCSRCGAKIEPTSRFCSNCGKATSLAAVKEEEERVAEGVVDKEETMTANSSKKEITRDVKERQPSTGRKVVMWSGRVLFILAVFFAAVFIISAFYNNAPITVQIFILVVFSIIMVIAYLMMRVGD